MTTATITRSAVLDIFRNPTRRVWSIQGLGMLRTYLDDEESVRLHIWNPRAAVKDVSTIHDHPWDFTSRIISGRITNVIYEEVEDHRNLFGEQYQTSDLICGVGGGLVEGTTRTVRLARKSVETYTSGMSYSQDAEEVHESFPSQGAVSIITRTFRPQNRDVAKVAWKTGDWVSAEPRPATLGEIIDFTGQALLHWDD